MATDTELTRIADAINALRPDWPTRSVRAYLASKHRDRAYADLAVAMTAVATDPDSTTPARLDHDGRWWLLTSSRVAAAFVPSRPHCPIHPDELAGAKACPRCVAEAVPSPGVRQLATTLEVPS